MERLFSEILQGIPPLQVISDLGGHTFPVFCSEDHLLSVQRAEGRQKWGMFHCKKFNGFPPFRMWLY